MDFLFPRSTSWNSVIKVQPGPVTTSIMSGLPICVQYACKTPSIIIETWLLGEARLLKHFQQIEMQPDPLCLWGESMEILSLSTNKGPHRFSRRDAIQLLSFM